MANPDENNDDGDGTLPLNRNRAPALATTLPLTTLPGSTESQSKSDRASLRPTITGRERFEPGSILASQYQISDVKAGGMGRVYLAEDLSARKKGRLLKVAIKSVMNFDQWQSVQL